MIETFEELFKKIKKLHKNAEIETHKNSRWIEFKAPFGICYSIKEKTNGLQMYLDCYEMHEKVLKDPQKIYNVIKAIKLCEEK